MSTSPEHSPTNGHLSPPEEDQSISIPDRDQSESDLSDVQAPVAESPSAENSDAPDSPPEDAHLTHEDHSESSDNDNNASDDGDFDMADSPASARSDAEEGRNESVEARPPPKRKAQAIEDDFMRENPELYGLRRSV